MADSKYRFLETKTVLMQSLIEEHVQNLITLRSHFFAFVGKLICKRKNGNDEIHEDVELLEGNVYIFDIMILY